MAQSSAEHAFTVIKLDHQGKEKIRYRGTLSKQFTGGVVIQAEWTLATYDLGYVRFETGDIFVEYYYTERWFNIFAIYSSDGIHKGWYCNIVEPARISRERIEQVDLLLDVWINPAGEPLILDEDEFAQADLSEWQREGARQGLQDLLTMLATHEEVFSSLRSKIEGARGDSNHLARS